MTIKQEFTELNLHPDCEDSHYYWVNATELKSWWKRDRTYLSNRSGPPQPNAFTLSTDTNEPYYCFPCIQILQQPDGNAVYVQGGADSLKWLLDLGVDEIPVAIYRDVDIEKAGTGLILRRLLVGDTIRVPDFDIDSIVEKLMAQRAAVYDGMFDDLFKMMKDARLRLSPQS